MSTKFFDLIRRRAFRKRMFVTLDLCTEIGNVLVRNVTCFLKALYG